MSEETERQKYIRKLALYLNDLGPCPSHREHGLTFEQSLKCERPALDLAFDEAKFKGRTS